MAITLNDNVQINAPKVLDNKYMKFSAGSTQPWASSTEANTNILSAYRYQYLTVLAIMNGDPVEYWYRTGTADINLEPKSKESYTLNGTGSIVLTTGYLYHTILIQPVNNITGLTIGTSPGGTDIEAGVNITAGAVYTAFVPTYVGPATTWYFTNPAVGTKIWLYKTF